MLSRFYFKYNGAIIMKEKCGIFGIYSTNNTNVTPLIISGLQALQHRGQESWGIAIDNNQPVKQMGLVSQTSQDVLNDKKNEGTCGIGHVRYSTLGHSMLENAHPLNIGDQFRLAHNGTIINLKQLKKGISNKYSMSKGITDTKLLGLRLLQEYNNNNKNLFKTFEKLNSEIIGAYTLAIIDSNNVVYGVRDPVGFRPLCIGYHKPSKSYIISSESCALDAIEAKLIRDVEPGEIVSLSEHGLKSYKFNTEKNRSHCSFEYIYFAHPSSSIDGVNVYSTRKKIGQILAKNKKLKADLIIPVPDSARPAALGYSQASSINLEEGLIKDRYKKRGSLRSFIEPTQKRRESIVKQIIPISASVKNKDIIVVDDSLVRGTSLKVLTKTLKKAGAKKIKLAFTFPPISFPCYMGVDFPTQNELLAYKVLSGNQNFKLVGDTIAKKLNVDEIIFNDLNGLSKGIGISLDNLCTACITGDYSALKYKPDFKSKREKKIHHDC